MNDGDPSGFEARGVGIAGYPRLTCLSKISAYCEQVDAELSFPQGVFLGYGDFVIVLGYSLDWFEQPSDCSGRLQVDFR